MAFWSDYGLFLAKIITGVVAILILAAGLFALARKGKQLDKNKLEVKKLNEKYHQYAQTINAETLTKKHLKQFIKETNKKIKALEQSERKRVFMVQFHGDIKASAVQGLREEITAILSVAKPTDEVVVCLDSSGGMVSAYGLAASQLSRLKQKKIPLTVIIDKVAASGGYLMACVADKVLAAPFAIIGSIGVIAQLPNFHRLLKRNDIDFEQITAGEYKRTLTVFGENTEKGRQKMREEVEEIHTLFKNFIEQNRPQVSIPQVATGEYWLAARALELKLIDATATSDDYLLTASEHADVFQIKFTARKSLSEKLFAPLGHATESFKAFFTKDGTI